MKYGIWGIMAAAVLTAAGGLLSQAETAERTCRIHQHLTARRDTGCSCGGLGLCTHLPLVIIDTRGQEIPGAITGNSDRFGQMVYTKAEDGETTICADMAVIDNQNPNNHVSDKPQFTTDCRFRIRGNASRRFPKSSYAVTFVDGEGSSRNIPVMGMDAHHEWVLNGPILDKTLIRNYMWYNIAGELMDYAPNVRFCEVVLNGKYDGLYLMAESITAGKDGRLNLSANVKNAEITGYLLRHDRPTEEDLEIVRDIYTYPERVFQIAEDVAIRYPGKSKLTEEIARKVELDYSAFQKALFSYDYNSKEYGYENWIDVDSFVDYYLINEFTGNLDAGSYSTYIYKEMGGKFKLCVWDFNNACDNYQEKAVEPEEFLMTEVSWYFMLFKDEDFVKQVQRRYRELRKTYLGQEYLMKYIDETIAFLGPAIRRNNERWALELTEWDGLVPKERNVYSYQAAVEQLKGWLTRRGNWMDGSIHSLLKYAHPSRNRIYNH